MATKQTISAARTIVIAIAQKGAETEALVEKLRGLKGMDYEAFEAVRQDFVSAYCAGRGVDPTDKAANAAARKGWSRLMAALGIKKPQADSAEAKRKREARAAAKPAPSDEGEPMPPASAAKVGERVRMELVPDEAHLIKLIRSHKLAAAVEFIHRMAEDAAAF